MTTAAKRPIDAAMDAPATGLSSRIRRSGERLLALTRRKQTIDAEIEGEQRRPAPCSLTLQRLKRRRLAIKERIEQIRRLRHDALGSRA